MKWNETKAKNQRPIIPIISHFTVFKMSDQNQFLNDFGKRIQRCYGCFIAFHLKDMWLGEDVTFFCENCKDDTMFHFDDFSKLMDPAKLREAEEDNHHH